MILLSHPTGNQNSRHAALAASERELLYLFATAISINSKQFGIRLLPRGIREEMARRDFTPFARGRIKSIAPGRELLRLAAVRLGCRRLIRHESGFASVDAVYRSCDLATASLIDKIGAGLQVIHVYEDGALESLRAARRHGIKAVYELPIGYWRAHRRLCEQERQLQPAWSHTWTAGMDSQEKTQKKDEELALADVVIVPSRFVESSLSDHGGDLPPVRILPYGCPAPIKADERQWYKGGQLKLLFVGGLTQRKGISYLIEAVKGFRGQVSISFIGTGPGASLIRQSLPQARLLGTMPHDMVLEQMRNHDVLVFPSIFEGFGLVVTEALAQGLPVVCTRNAGASDLIDGTEAGAIVPIRSATAIAISIESFLMNPGKVTQAGEAALSIAGNNSWDKYRSKLVSIWAGNDSD